MSNVVVEFVGRSMDYIQRQLKLVELTTDITGEENSSEFSHITNSIQHISMFLEGSRTFEIFTTAAINRIVQEAVAAGNWFFIQGLQQYVFAVFSRGEILEVIDQLSFAIAPNKRIDEKETRDNEYAQSPIGEQVYENTPDIIANMLSSNLWLLPLVALGASNELPIFTKEEVSNGQ